MLKCQRESARKQQQQKEALIMSDVAEQREAVQAAQWKFFVSALKQDQALLAKVYEVPTKVKAKIHNKMVTARKQQAEAGEKSSSPNQSLGDHRELVQAGSQDLCIYRAMTWANGISGSGSMLVCPLKWFGR